MKEKICPKCSVVKTEESCSRHKTGPKAGKFRSLCRTCNSAESKSWHVANPEQVKALGRKRQNDFLARILFIKAERPCYDCGGMFPPEAMDFDHVSGTKSFTISQVPWLSWDAVREEIDKCQLVCSNCHRVRTKTRRNPGWNARRPSINSTV